MSSGTQSVDRAAEVLTYVIRAEGPVSFTAVTEHTGLARSTASRLLQALERGGLLERNRDGLFRGGALFAEYASRFDRLQTLAAAAQPELERVGEETSETVTLGVPSGDTVVHIAQVDSAFVLGAVSWENVEVPAHTSALGKVMYAYGALPLPQGRLARPTHRSLRTRAALEADLEGVRRHGWAATSEEFEEGLDAVAAPVRWPDGTVHAAIGVSGPTLRIGGGHEQLGALLTDAAQVLSATIARRRVQH
ncbi:IclR family transcriptional regulator [Brevibacterium album]|uniref:IclR family transcriptional regulator n=1 Tax=Brevibacterium album TaxID=417948 RepID=UPI000413359D|nr:IclR family transcriptional regulator [Brevibacterium album]